MADNKEFKNKLLAANSRFDLVAENTSSTWDKLMKPFSTIKKMTNLRTAQNTATVRYYTDEMVQGLPDFIKKIIPKSSSQKLSKFIGKYVGGILILTTYGIATKAEKIGFVKDFANTHLLGFLQSDAAVPKAVAELIAKAHLTPYLTPIAVTASVVSVMAMVSLYQNREMLKAGSHQKDYQAAILNIVGEAIEGGYNSAKLDKLVKNVEKTFKPDFTPQQTQAIRDSLAAYRSENKILGDLAPNQREAMEKIADTLTRQYAVPKTLLLNAGLQMLVEMDGSSLAVLAKLKSRNIEEDWVKRFEMNPNATLKGVRGEFSPTP